MPYLYTQSALIEQPAIRLPFVPRRRDSPASAGRRSGRTARLGADSREVGLRLRLLTTLTRLNPGLPAEAGALAAQELTRECGAGSLANANREVYHLLKDGVKIALRNAENYETVKVVCVVD